MVVAGVYAALIGALEATLPLEAADIFGFDSRKAGLLFIPAVCSRVVAGPIGGWAVDH